MPLYDVFLSHASADKPAVEHLARKLQEAGIKPFLDKWHLVPGERWIPGLDEALAQSSTFAVFLGPGSAGGAWRTREVESALVREAREESFRVMPVLLPGVDGITDERLSRFLELFTWVDFRAGLDNEDAFRRLLAGIRGEPLEAGEKPPLPYRCMTPPREPFIERSEYGKVREALLASSGQATTVGITTAIHGAGGFGKTALAIELCYDPMVRAQYPDGILWTTMGEEIDAAGRLARVLNLIRWWTDSNPPAFQEDSREAAAYLRGKLAGKRVLLVVDDVWRPEDVTPFQGLGPGTALLVTTRDSGTLPADSVPIPVDALKVMEAVRLLGSELPNETGVDLTGLARRLGEWPLLLKIVHRQLRELIKSDGLSLEQALREVNEALDAEGLTVFDRGDLAARHEAVAHTVGASLRRLSGEEIGRFEQLAIFPEDKGIPLRALEKLWGLGAFAAKKLCGRLHDLSLLLRFDRLSGTIRLHDVIRAYLLKRGESHLSEWNQRFLDAYRPASGRWPDLPRDEGYLWSFLIHHLIGAGQSDVGRPLLLDFHYLESKLRATDINALLADYSFFVEKDQELRLVRDALRLSAHVLANPAALRGQLLGRLLDRQEEEIRSLLLQADEGSGSRWLRPRKASLTRPGGALIRTIYHPGEVRALAMLPDGQVVSGSDNGTLRVWDLESGKDLQVLEGHSGWVNAVTFLDGRGLISASGDRTVRVWDVESRQAVQTFKGHSLWVGSVAVLDGRRVVSGSGDRTLRVWDLESGETLQTLKGHTREISSVAVLDSGRIVSGSVDGTLRVWDVESGQTLRVLEGHTSLVSIVVALEGGRVVSGSADRTLRVWDVESGQTVQVLEGHLYAITTMAVLDSRRLISASADRMLRVWDVESGQTLHVFEGHTRRVLAVTVLDGRRVVSGSADQTLRVWDLELESEQSLQVLERNSSGISDLAVLDGRQVVSGSNDQTLWVWDVESGQARRILEKSSSGISAGAVLDSRRVVAGSEDGTLRVWDLESGEVLQVLAGHSDRVRVVSVLDNRQVVSGSRDGTLRVWDVESGKVLQVLVGHSDWIRTLAVLVLETSRVVTGSEDGTLRVWDVESGKVFKVLKGHSDWVRALAVLDSRRLVSGSADGTLRVWDVERGQTLQVLKGHSRGVNAVAASGNLRLLSGSDDGTLRVWNLESGEVECLFTLDAPVTAIAILPGNCAIAAGDSSGRVHFFDFVEP